MNPQPERFDTTQWSEVLLAGNPNQSGAKEALDRLCRKYWFPVYVMLRKRGSSHSDAEDLTQAFFADVLSSNKIGLADRSRGRFRWFLLTACNNFVTNTHRRQNSKSRGGGKEHHSIDVDMESGTRRYAEIESKQWTPEQLFDKRWALELIKLATNRVQNEYNNRGQAKWFAVLQPYIAPAGDSPPHSKVAEQLNVSVGSVKTAVYRLRKRFGIALQEEVAETVYDRDDIKDELNILLDALTGV
jgi:RNA polymerase sigma-70 factor (ECF subfamily)